MVSQLKNTSTSQYSKYLDVQDWLIEYTRLRLGIIKGVATGRDLIEE